MAEQKKQQKCKKKDDCISVITISETLMKRLISGPDTETDKVKEWDEDKKWKELLKCMEDNHTEKYRLTEDEFYKTAKSVEARIAALTYVRPCYDESQNVVDCYKQFPGQILNCDKAVREYTDCSDTSNSKDKHDDNPCH